MPPNRSALFNDLYQLTMSRAYLGAGRQEEAVFELFCRALPPDRNFLLAAGLADALDFLEHFAFTAADLDYLRSLGMFPDDFLEALAGLRFTGDVRAIPEGTVVFPHEPLIEVRAPLPEAQLVETMLINRLNAQTAFASKAARGVLAAGGRPVVDFGARRAHGTDAGLRVARAAYLAGFAGTSNLLAGQTYGIEVFGTMAHSYIQSFEHELEAFRSFTRFFPETTLLIDTYDEERAVARIAELKAELGQAFAVRAVRIDSGDLLEVSRRVRAALDHHGLGALKIFASGGLDERAVAELLEHGAPIDGFGIGTRLAAATDAPTLDAVYKLVACGGRPRMKLSGRKRFHPGRKQVYRQSAGGHFTGDRIARLDEPAPDGQPLLVEVMRGGERTEAGRAGLEAARQRAADQLARLPEPLRRMDPADAPYPVRPTEALEALRAEVAEALGEESS